MEKIRISAIVGSLCRDSFNRQLAPTARDAAGDEAEFTLPRIRRCADDK